MTKTYDYIIVLKKKSFELVDNISKLMLLMSVAAFLFDAYATLTFKNTKLSESSAWLLLCLSAAIIGWWVFCYLQQKRGVAPYYRFALMFAAWGWITIPSGLGIALVYLAACFLEKPVKVPPEVAFDSEEIVFNSFPQKRYNWSVVSNVVLKDGLVSIDLKNNKLIQKAVDEAVPTEIEAEFNSFCKERIQ
ncbi:hypothetical protein [Parasediminibacterium sp. JCM 36343]|uniref:hypothetical protein n=1 Tax=Parasediminibacterium sp. JCM 36343 TaxID=3374279 RepID=UPI0039784615